MTPWKSPACFAGLALLLGALPGAAQAPADSPLWGRAGERWTPASRLPDFSRAGYHCGDRPLPDVPPGVSINSFGAVGDGVHDDTAAFEKALATAPAGAIEIPPGRYKITRILEITRSGLVLRGAGPDRSILFFPTPLETIRPNAGETTSGRPTSNYSWSGGFLWIRGQYEGREIGRITVPLSRGAASLPCSNTAGLKPGQWVRVEQRDAPDNSLATHLYSGDPGDMTFLKGSTRASLISRIRALTNGQVVLERPLRFDLRPGWNPRLLRFDPTVTEVGIEHLGFEFPPTPYGGHFTELGYNAVAIQQGVNCWVRNVRILNADSGFFVGGHFNTLDTVVFESRRKPDAGGCNGHHGIYFEADDNLFTRFDFRMKFIHDLTVSHCAGNVCSAGRGVDLCFDHHKRAPYENLFTDIDLGAGTRPWVCGGGAGLGKHAGARTTFWNLRARKPLPHPPSAFGPASLNLVGLETAAAAVREPEGKWLEPLPPGGLQPANLHQAQLARRRAAAAE